MKLEPDVRAPVADMIARLLENEPAAEVRGTVMSDAGRELLYFLWDGQPYRCLIEKAS